MQSWRLWLGLVSTSDTTRTVKPCLIFNGCLKSDRAPPSSSTGGFPQGTGGLSLLPRRRAGSGTSPVGGAFKGCHTHLKVSVKMQNCLRAGDTLQNHLLQSSSKLVVRNFLNLSLLCGCLLKKIITMDFLWKESMT